MLTRTRGSDFGNMVAITCGLLTTIVLSKIPFEEIDKAFPNLNTLAYVAWLPKVAFTWFALVGALVVFCVGVLFRTPESVLSRVQMRIAQCAAEGYEDTPLSMRDDNYVAPEKTEHGESSSSGKVSSREDRPQSAS
jgi:hypothetical protein